MQATVIEHEPAAEAAGMGICNEGFEGGVGTAWGLAWGRRGDGIGTGVGHLTVGMAWGWCGTAWGWCGDRLMTHWGLGTRWGAVHLTWFNTLAITQRLSGARSPNQAEKK